MRKQILPRPLVLDSVVPLEETPICSRGRPPRKTCGANKKPALPSVKLTRRADSRIMALVVGTPIPDHEYMRTSSHIHRRIIIAIIGLIVKVTRLYPPKIGGFYGKN